MLSGAWNLRGLATELPRLRSRLKRYARQTGLEWDLNGVDILDSAGAYVLWQVWGERFPEHLQIRAELVAVFDRWRKRQIPSVQDAPRRTRMLLEPLKRNFSALTEQMIELLILLGQLIIDLGYVISHPRDFPWRETSATLHDAGVRALGITALVGFLIGIVLSYLSALQLKNYGAQAFAVNIMGLGIIRELGPTLAAVLVAGRSGSAMTAQLGVMRVTQELDALAALGISASQRLILPNVVALMIGMPLLVVWTDAMALVGGAVAAKWELDFGYYQFFTRLPDVVPVSNLIIGLGKGAVFGLCIGLIASHFGLRTQPNTQSLGRETTHSVVTSITLVILIDALFAVVFDDVGMP
ncbi:MAG: ABC transporter permease [Methylohalobius crimeensis]